MLLSLLFLLFFFFFNDTATTEIYTFPYTTLFRSAGQRRELRGERVARERPGRHEGEPGRLRKGRGLLPNDADERVAPEPIRHEGAEALAVDGERVPRRDARLVRGGEDEAAEA